MTEKYSLDFIDLSTSIIQSFDPIEYKIDGGGKTRDR